METPLVVIQVASKFLHLKQPYVKLNNRLQMKTLQVSFLGSRKVLMNSILLQQNSPAMSKVSIYISNEQCAEQGMTSLHCTLHTGLSKPHTT